MAYTDLSGSKLKRRLGATMNESVSAPVSSFAKRQLEKMGWKEGTGLGKNRDGSISHIRVQKREDEVGLGIEKEKIRDASDMWWAHSVGSTLARLSSTVSSSSSSSSSLSNGSELVERRRKKKKKKENKREEKSFDESGSKSKKRKRDEEGVDYDLEKTERKVKEKKKKKKRRKEKSSGDGSCNDGSKIKKVFTDHDLFLATGGMQFGMRARPRRLPSSLSLSSDTTTAETERDRTGPIGGVDGGARTKRANDEDEEKKARSRIEWNGLGEAKLLLSDGGGGKGGRKKLEAGIAEVTPSSSGDEGLVCSSGRKTNDDDGEGKVAGKAMERKDKKADNKGMKREKGKGKKRRGGSSFDTEKVDLDGPPHEGSRDSLTDGHDQGTDGKVGEFVESAIDADRSAVDRHNGEKKKKKKKDKRREKANTKKTKNDAKRAGSEDVGDMNVSNDHK